MQRLRQRLLYKVLKKRKRPDDRTLLYLINKNFIMIRKQKDRRRRKTLKKLFGLSRERYKLWKTPM